MHGDNSRGSRASALYQLEVVEKSCAF